MYSRERLVILDADGTTIDAFSAIEKAFAAHGMEIGDLERFQKRRNLFKYIGGLKEFPTNLKRNLGRRSRAQLVDTLTQLYREETPLYDDIHGLLDTLIATPGVRVGVITRNITHEPVTTLQALMRRNGIDPEGFDFFTHIPLKESKVDAFAATLERFAINPARAYACGDEKKDYLASLAHGIHPFMVSYGFEDYDRLTQKIGVPGRIISRSPLELRERVFNALGLGEED